MAMEQQNFPFLKKTAHAVLSEDRKYRYVLYRSLDGEAWDQEEDLDSGHPRATICWVMLNPSTADEAANDPTIEKVMKFSRRWGYHRLVVVNLFAIRETDSKKLASLASGTNIIGPENDDYIPRAVVSAHKIVCAWGKQGSLFERGSYVARQLLALNHVPIECFKKNLDGSPVHPLYQPDAAELVEYR
jgi:hypothetical protein